MSWFDLKPHILIMENCPVCNGEAKIRIIESGLIVVVCEFCSYVTPPAGTEFDASLIWKAQSDDYNYKVERAAHVLCKQEEGFIKQYILDMKYGLVVSFSLRCSGNNVPWGEYSSKVSMHFKIADYTEKKVLKRVKELQS